MRLASFVFLFFVQIPAAFSLPPPSLSAEQIKSFRSWIVTIVEDQIHRGPNPRWRHRDCAGLVRFAIHEALESHDPDWRRANGLIGRALPAELDLSRPVRDLLKLWKTTDGTGSAFVRALPMIQQNTEFLGKTAEKIDPGDLLFFDQGDEQHVMIWTGRRTVYHNGHIPRVGENLSDNGLRAVTLSDLMKWKDTRWQPRAENPNFIGYYRLAFLRSPKMNEQGSP